MMGFTAEGVRGSGGHTHIIRPHLRRGPHIRRQPPLIGPQVHQRRDGPGGPKGQPGQRIPSMNRPQT